MICIGVRVQRDELYSSKLELKNMITPRQKEGPGVQYCGDNSVGCAPGVHSSPTTASGLISREGAAPSGG